MNDEPVIAVLRRMKADGYGHEDCYVRLRLEGRPLPKRHVRQYWFGRRIGDVPARELPEL